MAGTFSLSVLWLFPCKALKSRACRWKTANIKRKRRLITGKAGELPIPFWNVFKSVAIFNLLTCLMILRYIFITLRRLICGSFTHLMWAWMNKCIRYFLSWHSYEAKNTRYFVCSEMSAAYISSLVTLYKTGSMKDNILPEIVGFFLLSYGYLFFLSQTNLRKSTS